MECKISKERVLDSLIFYFDVDKDNKYDITEAYRICNGKMLENPFVVVDFGEKKIYTDFNMDGKFDKVELFDSERRISMDVPPCPEKL